MEATSQGDRSGLEVDMSRRTSALGCGLLFMLCVPEDQLPQVTLASVSFLYIRKSEDRGGWEELLILMLDWEGINMSLSSSLLS